MEVDSPSTLSPWSHLRGVLHTAKEFSSSAVVPIAVSTIADGVLKTMMQSKRKMASLGVVLMVFLGASTLVPKGGIEVTAAPAPKAEKDEGLIWLHNTKTGVLTSCTPDGKKVQELTLKDGKHFLGITPNGTKLAFVGKKGKLAEQNDTVGLTLHLRDVNDQTTGDDLGLEYKPDAVFIWSPDHKLVVRRRVDEVAEKFVCEHLLFDIATKTGKKIDLPANHYLSRWSPDGKTWQVYEYVLANLRDPNLPRYRMFSVPVGGGKLTPLCEKASIIWLEPTGDGQSFFGVGHLHTNPPDDDEDATYRRWLHVSAKGEATTVKSFEEFTDIDLRLAPDRKRVIILGHTTFAPGEEATSAATLRMYDTEGKQEQKLLTIPGDGEQTRLLGWSPPRHKITGPPPKEVKDGGFQRSLYHADPEHLWNRLHETLFVRIGPDGRAYGQDRLEPLLWLESTHLLEEKSNKKAVTILEEFLKGKGEKLVEDPQKRALLQRDLWLVFNWLESDHWLHQKLKEEDVRAARDRLRRPLAAVIGRLALTPDQIKKLPDNYAAAVASGEFAKRFDPEHPDKPYLPADLFAADGPWVCLGRPDGPIAPTHLRDDATNPYTNSAFLLFLRLPAGRPATVEYLKQLRSFDQPLRVEAKDKKLLEKYLPNPKLPSFPVGTEVALVRRALLIDSSNTPIATALTESVQIRMYRDIPEMTEQALKAALDSDARTNQRARSWQSFQEFQLSRSRLYAGKAGGLRTVRPDDRDFHSPFSLSYHDEFDSPKDSPRDPPFSERSQFSIKADCFQCHSLPGVASFNSYFNSRTHLSDRDATARPCSLSETPVSEVAEAAVKWKMGRPNWTALRKLLAE